MLEFGLAFALSIIAGKFADRDNEPGFLWGFVTFGLCIALMFTIDLPFLRVMIAGAVGLALYIAVRILKKSSRA